MLANQENLFTTADSLLENGQYREASLAYERVFFEHGNALIQAEANLGRAKSLRSLREYETAMRVLNRTRYNAISDNLHFKIRAERVLVRYLSRDWRQVINELNQITFFLPEMSEQKEELAYIRILALNELQNWDDAFELAVQRYGVLENFDELSTQYQNQPSLKSPERAGWIATFVPGGGQMYAGEWREGLVSAGLQFSALGWMGYNLWTGYYATAILTGGGVFQAVYFGGTDRAQILTERNNNNTTIRYNETLRNLILNFERQIQK